MALAGVVVAAAVTADGGEREQLAKVPGSSTLIWSANFDSARGPCDFEGAGWNPYGGADAPPCPQAVRIVPSARLPESARFPSVARFAVRRSDAARSRPRFHAKLYRPFFAGGESEQQVGQHGTRPPADVSGVYRAWFLLPRGFTIPRGAWRNVMQFKERYWDGREPGYRSDPSWYLVLTAGRGGIVAGVRHWSDGEVRGFGRSVSFPRGRWVRVEAVVEQARYIDWYIDGRRIARGTERQERVGPIHGPRSLAWEFVVGNYAGAGHSGAWANRVSRPLYIARAERRTR
jgi:hypothetical protein